MPFAFISLFTTQSYPSMKQFIQSTSAFSLLFALSLFIFLAGCSPIEEPEIPTDPEIAAKSSSFGSCPSCPLTGPMTGSLPAFLYPGSDFNLALSNCYTEDLSNAGNQCQWNKWSSPVSATIPIYLQFSTFPGNDVTNHCNFLVQVGYQLSQYRPSGNWLLYEVGDLVHITGSDYQIQVKWRNYICKYNPVKK